MQYVLATLFMFAAIWTLYEARDLPSSQFYWIWAIALILAALAGISLHAA